VVLVAVPVTVALLVWALRAFGGDSASFAFVVVWLPMTALGTISHVAPPRLPERFHRLRRFELDGRLYERVGVRVAKRLLRRGPLAVFNPGLHMPSERTPEQLARLDQRMRDAEASHAILFVATLAVVAHAALRGWWSAAIWTLLFDVLVNGYPVLLQRYNRARLRR
jgi:Glycosyl-4,4'-diaponeurosporenoate acyltransferase